MRTHYDNLHVSEKAGPEVIKGAYKALAQKWHPDKHPNQREKAERYFKIITRAFEVLSDPKARAEYDAWLSSQRSTHQKPKTEPTKEPSKQSHEQDQAEAWDDGKRSRELGFKEKDCPYRDYELKLAWLEGFRSSDPSVQPAPVKRAVTMLWWVIAIGILKTIISLSAANSFNLSEVVIAVVVLALVAFIVSEISEGKNWARITFLVLFVAGSYIELLTWSSSPSINELIPLLSVIQVIIQIVALAKLFSAPGKYWFAAGKNSG